MRKSYPLGAADLTNEIKEAKASGADTFLAYSYPPDTFMLTNTAITQGFNPKVFYTAVGTAFAAYGANFKEQGRRACSASAAGIRTFRARRTM